MSNKDWKDETVQELKKGYMAMITDRATRIATLEAENARLTKDAKLNDMAWNDNQAALKKQAEEIIALKLALCITTKS